jgi:hypothetical protein
MVRKQSEIAMDSARTIFLIGLMITMLATAFLAAEFEKEVAWIYGWFVGFGSVITSIGLKKMLIAAVKNDG